MENNQLHRAEKRPKIQNYPFPTHTIPLGPTRVPTLILMYYCSRPTSTVSQKFTSHHNHHMCVGMGIVHLFFPDGWQ